MPLRRYILLIASALLAGGLTVLVATRLVPAAEVAPVTIGLALLTGLLAWLLVHFLARRRQ